MCGGGRVCAYLSHDCVGVVDCVCNDQLACSPMQSCSSSMEDPVRCAARGSGCLHETYSPMVEY